MNSRVRLYIGIWVVLFLLTVVEVLFAQMSVFTKQQIVAGLLFMSSIKALCVALFYMHLWWERLWLGLLAASPFVITAGFALLLMLENAP